MSRHTGRPPKADLGNVHVCPTTRVDLPWYMIPYGRHAMYTTGSITLARDDEYMFSELPLFLLCTDARKMKEYEKQKTKHLVSRFYHIT